MSETNACLLIPSGRPEFLGLLPLLFPVSFLSGWKGSYFVRSQGLVFGRIACLAPSIGLGGPGLHYPLGTECDGPMEGV
jgi:hypothetical protein